LEFIPTEYAWVVPIIIPLLVGAISGVIVKRALKLIIVVVVLIIILAALGYTQFPSIESLMSQALTYLPLMQENAGPLINILPYSSTSFLIGLALGIWRS